MRKLILGVLATCVFALPARAQQTSLRQEVDGLMTAMVAAFKADPVSVAAFYTDDASILGGGGNAIGRVQIDKYWRDGGAMFADLKLEVVEVGGDGASPWVRGRSTVYGKSGMTMATEFVGILKRQADGQTQVLR